MGKIRKFNRLPLIEKGLLFQSAFYLGAFWIALKVVPFKYLPAFVQGIDQRKARQKVSPERIIWAVATVARRLPFIKCLGQALAANMMLAMNGFASELKIGVTKDKNGRLEAHAWVESRGRVLIGNLPDLARFEPLVSRERLRG